MITKNDLSAWKRIASKGEMVKIDAGTLGRFVSAIERMAEGLRFYSNDTGLKYSVDQDENGEFQAPSLVDQDGGELAETILEEFEG